MSWRDIWSRRQVDVEGGEILQKMLHANGFDSMKAEIGADNWLAYAQAVADFAGISTGDDIFELGCGCGAFLYPFYARGHRVGGCDYSAPLVAAATRVMPEGAFEVCEAAHVRLDRPYDFVVSNSVFHYFPDRGYAREVLARMFAGARRAAIVLDVPDEALSAEAEAERRAWYPEGEYEKRYAGLAWTVYSRNWFEEAASDLGARCRFQRQDIKNYGNSRFRFNVVLERTIAREDD